MPFTASEKTAITALWSKASAQAVPLGAEALERMFTSFPHTKTYFSHFNLSHGSPDLQKQGGAIMKAIGSAVQNLDNIAGTLSALSDLHAHTLRVDPSNFGMLIHCILVTMANHYPKEFNATTHVAMDKFLCRVAEVLVAKYR